MKPGLTKTISDGAVYNQSQGGLNLEERPKAANQFYQGLLGQKGGQ
jgi:hypothetical protein